MNGLWIWSRSLQMFFNLSAIKLLCLQAHSMGSQPSTGTCSSLSIRFYISLCRDLSSLTMDLMNLLPIPSFKSWQQWSSICQSTGHVICLNCSKMRPASSKLTMRVMTLCESKLVGLFASAPRLVCLFSSSMDLPPGNGPKRFSLMRRRLSPSFNTAWKGWWV